MKGKIIDIIYHFDKIIIFLKVNRETISFIINDFQLTFYVKSDKIFDHELNYKKVQKKHMKYFDYEKYYGFIQYKFDKISDFYKYKKQMKNQNCEIFQANVPPVLQFLHEYNIPGCCSVEIKHFAEVKKDKITNCKHEYSIPNSKKNIEVVDEEITNKLYIMSYDIEVYSSTGAFPNAQIPNDVIFQIGIVFNYLDSLKDTKKYMLTLKNCDIFDEDTTTLKFEHEHKLIEAFFDLIKKQDPDVITGYNTQNFDEKYIIERCFHLHLDDYLNDFSRIVKKKFFKKCSVCLQKRANYNLNYDDQPKFCSECKTDNMKCVNGNRSDYLELDSEGRLKIDLYEQVKKNYNLGSYKLDDVSSHFNRIKISKIEKNVITVSKIDFIQKNDFINIIQKDTLCNIEDDLGKFEILDIQENEITLDKEIPLDCQYTYFMGPAKDDVSALQIFKAYEKGNVTDIAKYCVKDTFLCNLLLEKLQFVNNASAMAQICFVTMDMIFNRGQIIKGFSLITYEANKQDYLLHEINLNEVKECSENCIIKKQMNCYNENCVSNKSITTNEFYDASTEFEKKLICTECNTVQQAFDFTGAFVYDVEKAKIFDKPISVFDFGSLYPNIMIANNLSLETRCLNEVSDLNVEKFYTEFEDSLGKNNCLFVKYKKKAGIVPFVLDKLLTNRKLVKKQIKTAKDEFTEKLLDAKQLAYKLTANSIYGLFGYKKSPLYCKSVAASVTALGKKYLKRAEISALETIPKKVFEDNKLNEIFTQDEIEFLKHTYRNQKIKCRTVYGDSVIGDTPLLLRNKTTNLIEIKKIKDLSNDWQMYHGGKQACELDNYESWTENGWSKIKRVIRHRLHQNKKLLKVQTHCGIVIVSDEHSLLNEKGESIDASKITVGSKLLHSFPNKSDLINFKSNIDTKKIKCGAEFEYEDPVSALELYCLAKSLGFNVSVSSRDDKKNIYRILITKEKIEENPIEVKKISEYKYQEKFVYDLTTENQHFHGGIGEMIVHNTDSIFIDVGFTCINETFKFNRLLEKLYVYYEIFPKNLILEFEKVYHPLILLNKKKYIGNLFERENKFYMNSMGISLKRRDSSKLQKYFIGNIIKMLLKNEIDKKQNIKNFIKTNIQKLDQLPVNYFIMNKKLNHEYKGKKLTGSNKGKKGLWVWYDVETSYSHVILAQQLKKQSLNIESNSRIDFVYIDSGEKSDILEVETPENFKKNNLKLNKQYYIDSQIKQALSFYLELIFTKNEILDLFNVNDSCKQMSIKKFFKKK